MQKHKNEQGFSLVFSFALIILFTIIGLSLFTLSLNGMKKNESREATSQSSDQAEKGITYFSEMLNADLATKKDAILMAPDSKAYVNSLFADYLAKYGCSAGNTGVKNVASETGKYDVCIDQIKAGKSDHSRFVTFKSTGKAGNGKQQAQKASGEYGYSYVPGVLNYALSAAKDGNLFMFGGVEVIGNLKVEGDMFVRDQAFHSSTSNPTWEKSVLPRIIGHNNKPASLYLKNNRIVKLTGDIKPSDYINKIDNIIPPVTGKVAGVTYSLPESKYTFIQTNELHKALSIKSSDRQANIAPVVKPSYDDKLELKIKEIVEGVGTKLGNKSSVTIDNIKVDRLQNSNNNYTRNGTNSNLDANSAAYIPNNFTIGNSSSSDSSSYYNSSTINGVYYVAGNLKVQGAKFTGSPIIYVKGNVEISHSTINQGNPNETLFIFADGGITVNNISVGSAPNEPGKFNSSMISGFFYSNNDFLMYGVGSNIAIKGGISAKNTSLTALRGHAYNQLNKNTSSGTIYEIETGYACPYNEKDQDTWANSYQPFKDNIAKDSTNALFDRLLADFSTKVETTTGYWWNSSTVTTYPIQENHKIAGNTSRSLSKSDINILKKLLNSDSELNATEKSQINEVAADLTALLNNWSSNTSALNNYYYKNGNSYTKFNFSSNQFQEMSSTLTILNNLISGYYLSSDIPTKCANWSNLISTGGLSNILKGNVGNLNYSSRITIEYDNELIARYTSKDQINMDRTQLSQIEGKVSEIKYD